MRPRLATWFAISVVILVAACQSSGASPSTEAASPDAPSLEAPSSEPVPGSSIEVSSPDAGSTIDPDWVTQPALTCGDNKRLFPPEALDGPGLAEFGLDPAAAVLRSTIADTPDYFPDSGWHRVLENPDGVSFVAKGNAETPWFGVTVGLFDGVLQPVIMGQCTLAIASPDGVTFGRWWLDPAGPPLTPETTEVSILLREQACASGRPPEGRVLRPAMVVREDSIDVVIGIRITPGGADCPGNPAHALTLELPEPLGSRKLFDASQYPPRPVTTEDPG